MVSDRLLLLPKRSLSSCAKLSAVFSFPGKSLHIFCFLVILSLGCGSGGRQWKTPGSSSVLRLFLHELHVFYVCGSLRSSLPFRFLFEAFILHWRVLELRERTAGLKTPSVVQVVYYTLLCTVCY